MYRYISLRLLMLHSGPHAHTRPRSPHESIVWQYRPTASQSAVPESEGYCATCALFARACTPCHGGPTVTPEKNGGWGARSGVLSGDPGGALGACRLSRGPRRAAPSAPTGALFRVSGFGKRKRRYHTARYADCAHPGHWGAPLDLPGPNLGRLRLVSRPQKAP